MWVRTLLQRLAAEGRAVFVSSHLMSEMALTADHLVVIGRGRLIAELPMAEFVGQSSRPSCGCATPAPERPHRRPDRRRARTVDVERRRGHRRGRARRPGHRRPGRAPRGRPARAGPAARPRSRRPSWSSPTRASSSAADPRGRRRRRPRRPQPGRGGDGRARTPPAPSTARPAARRALRLLAGALRSEWTKLRTVRSTTWCVLATAVAAIGIGILATAIEASHWRHAGIVDRVAVRPHQPEPHGPALRPARHGRARRAHRERRVRLGDRSGPPSRRCPAGPWCWRPRRSSSASWPSWCARSLSFASFFIGQAHLVGIGAHGHAWPSPACCGR